MESYAAVYALLMLCICWGILDQAEQQPSSPAALWFVARKSFLGKIIKVFFLGKIIEVSSLGKIIEVFSLYDFRKYYGEAV